LAVGGVHDAERGWYHNAVFYGIDVATFRDGNGDGIGDLAGVIESLDYLAWLGIDAIWLMPCFTSPRMDNGYDVQDHFTIDPRLGSNEEFSRLASELHQRGMRVLLDLVVSHSSNQHPWFQSALNDPQSPFRDRYVWVDNPQSKPDRDPVFPGPEQSVWTFEPAVGAWYLHHFYDFEPSLNHEHPEVRREMRRIIEHWLDLGVDGFRVDAAPFLGDDLTDRPADPHDLIKDMRSWVAAKNKDAVLLGEADLDPEFLPEYFGKDNDEVQMLFNFILNQHLYLALADESAAAIDKAIDITPEIPPSGQWVHYLRNQDELSLLRLTESEQERVFDAFAPEPSMRIYGRGIRRRLAPMLNLDRHKIELLFSLEFSLPGVPLILYGNEVGLGEDLSLPERYAVRLPMPWHDFSHLPGADGAAPTCLLLPDLEQDRVVPVERRVRNEFGESAELATWVRDLIAVRKSTSELMRQQFRRLDVNDDRVYAHRWDGENESLICLHNLSNGTRLVDVPHVRGESNEIFATRQSGTRNGETLHVELDAYGVLWLRTNQVDVRAETPQYASATAGTGS
jgi:maltose alpha-D-glucosyltransferase/alpha-amylase